MDTPARALARIQTEISSFGASGAPPAEQVLARIAQVLADSGYDVPDALVARLQVLWTGPAPRRG